MIETTALGAAILAAIGIDLIDIDEMDMSQITKFLPVIGENGKSYIFLHICNNYT